MFFWFFWSLCNTFFLIKESHLHFLLFSLFFYLFLCWTNILLIIATGEKFTGLLYMNALHKLLINFN